MNGSRILRLPAHLRGSLRLAVLLGAAIGVVGGIVRPAFAGVEVAPHRAAYVLKLVSSSPGSTVVEAVGGMVYSWADTCDGWAVEQRYLLNITRAEAPGLQMVASSVTWESKDGLRYRFNVKRERNGRLTAEISGEAVLEFAGGPGEVRFDKPEHKIIALPVGTVFPTMHTLKLVEKARKGERLDRQLVFDGTQVEPSNPVSTFILPQREPVQSGALKPPLGPAPVWPMSLAFFSANGKDPAPEFEMSLDMQENGVVPRLLLDYGDFKVLGTIARAEALPTAEC